MAVILDSIGMIARSMGMTQVAAETGLGRKSLYKALRPDSNPEFLTVIKVVHALGVRFSAEPAPAPRELQSA
jgi:probable addiction module antidote protein